MGEKANKRSAFLAGNPFCCFCGGYTPATTIDHVPARTCFYKRIGPEGFEFPACSGCQTSSRKDEQIFGFYARLMDQDDGRYDKKDASRLLTGIMNNAPHLIPNLALPASAKRKALREYGIAKPANEFLEDIPLVGVPKDFHAAATVVGRKLALATHYRELGVIAGPDRLVTVHWSQLQIPVGADLSKQLEKLLANKTIGARVNTDIGNQFSYDWGFNEGEELFAICAQLCGSLMLLCAIAPAGRVQFSKHAKDWMPLTGPLPERT